MESVDGEVCGRCLRRPPNWRRLVALWSYEFPLDQLILSGKYRAGFDVLAWASERLAAQRHAFSCERSCGPFTLLPVPLSPARLAERGYNQALELAKGWVKQWPMDTLRADAVIRIRETAVQQALSWTVRRQNVRHAFAATCSLAGHRVILIDDVLTTGATLNE
ncbi:MAG: ComF family protein, partial [Casimicrobiaceae bacterium]